ncbi:hypothetical protein CIHG_01347 [Coccidioides immitis H538.4]|uniref:Uncharacterized protein n=1 Tax=Coccidioides immitis H538.4 TaxID=396776 RepID=A0A0J8RHS7_COCIT|nr:hypothetical protein CIHG_01347 [Coccidioides immitis H538.4]
MGHYGALERVRPRRQRSTRGTEDGEVTAVIKFISLGAPSAKEAP